MAEPAMYSFPAITRQEKRKQRQKKQEKMWKQPETLHLDMICHTSDIDNSCVLEYEDQLCDLQFVTHNLAAWKDVCLQHYAQKYEAGDITSFPSVSVISDGSQLKVAGSIVINYYSTGIVLVQGNQVHDWKDRDFPILKAGVKEWVDEANKSVIEMTELRNNSTLNVTRNVTAAQQASSPASVTTNTPTIPKAKATPKRKKSVMPKINPAKPMDSSTPCHKPVSAKPSPLLSPVVKHDVDSQQNDELSQISTLESLAINTTEDMPHQSPVNTSGRATKLQHVQCLGDSSLDLLHADSVTTNNTVHEYNSDASSLRVTPNCEHCKNLQDYITICEEAANTLREELAQLKQQASSTRPPATPTRPPATQPKTKERIKKTPKPKISFVGDSNARNLYRHLDSTKTDNAVWVNAGCKIEDVNSRVHHMIKDNDVGVIHLGTNDALSTKSDNDCLADCSDAMDSILDYSVQTPLIVCSVPPTRSQRGQRRVTMINTLLKYKCDMNNRLLFVDTGLTLSDIGNDGVHLTDSGKGKLARRIQCESLDFYRNISSRHM